MPPPSKRPKAKRALAVGVQPLPPSLVGIEKRRAEAQLKSDMLDLQRLKNLGRRGGSAISDGGPSFSQVWAQKKRQHELAELPQEFTHLEFIAARLTGQLMARLRRGSSAEGVYA